MSARIIAASLVVLFLPLSLRASREGSEAASYLGTSSEAAAAEGLFFEGVHKRLVQCQGVEDEAGEQESEGDNQKSVKKMEECVNAISQFAVKTKSQREKSMQANKNYAEDLVLAKKILRYLTKQTDDHVVKFNEFRSDQEQHLKEVEEMLQTVQQSSGPTAQDLYRQNSAGSLLSMDSRQAPVMGYQAMPPQPMAAQNWGGMAAMFSPSGQNFGLPGGLVGRRPSLLQLGPESPGTSGGSLQARLDREAEMLEERGDDPDA